MGKLNRLYNRIFNSPANFDEISYKKTKNLLFQIIFLNIVGWILFISISTRDILNRQTFISTQISNTTETPNIIFLPTFTTIDAFAVNNLSYSDNQDYNKLNFTNYYYCMRGNYSINYNCENDNLDENNQLNVTYQTNRLSVEKFNLTFQENYLNINIESMIRNKGMAFTLYIGDFVYVLSGPLKIEILFKKEIFIDQYGYETVNFVPNLVTSLMMSEVCKYYPTGEIVENCSSNTISLIYQTNIVTYYTMETNSELTVRVLKDTFSIGKLLLGLLFLILSFYARKFKFKKRTSWFENNIRDAVLYHFNYHVLEPKTTTPQGENKSIRLTELEQSLLTSNDRDESNIIDQQPSNNNSIDSETIGSESRFKRLLESIPHQDSYSKSLSRFSTIQYLVIGLILLGVGIFIIVKDVKGRLITTVYSDLDYVDLPHFNFTYETTQENVEYIWTGITEVLPNGDTKYCNIPFDQIYDSTDCVYTIDSKPYTSNTANIGNNNSVSYTNDTIALGRGEHYSFYVSSIYLYSPLYLSKDLLYIKLCLNDIYYYLPPYSNITIQLTKSVFHQPDGTEIKTYEPLVTAFPLMSMTIPVTNFTGNFSGITGYTLFNFQYSTNIVQDIYMEAWYQLALRILTDILAFVSPVQTVIVLLFTKILLKFIYKYPTTHVDYNTREAILYHLNHYSKYKKIFKKNRNITKRHSENLQRQVDNHYID